MTTEELAESLLPRVRVALQAAKPMVVDRVGRAGWIALWPAWAVVTGPLLKLVVRIILELAIGLTMPQLLPVLDTVLRFLPFLSEQAMPPEARSFLLSVHEVYADAKSQMMPEVRMALSVDPATVHDDGAGQPHPSFGSPDSQGEPNHEGTPFHGMREDEGTDR